MAKMMGQDDSDGGKNNCDWDENCITKVNGQRVPPSLKCVYTKEFEEQQKKT